VGEGAEVTEVLFDVKAGHFAVSKVVGADGFALRATRVAEVYPPGTEGQTFSGRPIESSPHQRVHLESLCLCDASSVVRFFETEAEAKLFLAERDLEKLETQLQEEKESHAATRAKLKTLKEMVARA